MTKQRHQVIPRTLCLVFNDREQVLLIKFSETKGAMAGFYSAPGGHIEHGESIITNAIHEIKEETNIEVKDTILRGVVHVTNFFGKNIMLYVTSSKAVTSDIIESNEGTIHWVDPNNIDELKVFKDMKHIIKRVKKSNKDVFTARSEFDDDGNLVMWEFD